MVDLEVLKKYGVSADDWKVLLKDEGRDQSIATPISGPKPKGEPGADGESEKDKRHRFLHQMWLRVQAGRGESLKHWKIYDTLDRIWAAPMSSTIPQDLIDGSDREPSQSLLNKLSSDLQGTMPPLNRDAKTGSTKPALDIDAFDRVVVPIVKSYLKTRQAKLVNDRNLDPLLHYQSASNTAEDRVRSAIVRARIGVMSKQMDHLASVNQALRDMLLYQRCIIFPRENWFRDTQKRLSGTKPDGNLRTASDDEASEMDFDEENGLESHTVREGIRYFIPHPTRVYFDQAFPARTLNRDVGCSYVGHWKVLRWCELADNEGFYNLDRVSYAGGDWWSSYSDYWNSLMNQCVINFPSVERRHPENAQENLASGLYSQSESDKSVFVCEHYDRIVPKDVGLGDYPYPIWARFVLAGDGTVIHASPLGYSSGIVFQDNGDDNLTIDAGLGQDLRGFQSQVTNLFTQYLLTVKQNLANLTLIDQNVIEPGWKEKIENLGSKMFSRLNIFWYNSKKLNRGQFEIGKGIVSHRFQPANTQEILQAIRTTLDLADRVLQFSAQDTAQAASHEQTEDEVQIVASTSNNVLAFTGIPVDAALEAMGRQLYEADMNYGDKDFMVDIATELLEEMGKKGDLEKLGIVVKGKPVNKKQNTMLHVTRVPAMLLDMFAVVPQIHERKFDANAAIAMGRWMQQVAANPMMSAAIGPSQFIMITNEIARLLGLPLPSPLVDESEKYQQQPQEEMQKMMAEMADQILTKVKEGMEPLIEATQSNRVLIEEIYRRTGIQLPDVKNSESPATGEQNQEANRLAATT